MLKCCRTCGKEKLENEFADHSIFGKHWRCIECQKLKKEERRLKHNRYIKIRYINNKEQISEYHRQRYIRDKERIKKRQEIYSRNNKQKTHERYLRRTEGIYKNRRGTNYGPYNTRVCGTCKIEKSLLEFNRYNKPQNFGFDYICKNCKNEKARNHYNQNKKDRQEYHKKYREENLELYKESSKKYRQSEYGKQKTKEYKSGVNFRIGSSISSRIRVALKEFNITKENHSLEYLGCDIKTLREYLESKFELNMNWENYGFGDDKWHIDHIIPIRAFDLRNEGEKYKCFNYKNLQPKWQADNIRKNDKMPDGTRARDIIK